MKRIVICADGTWNRPEKDLEKDFPTNVLKLARAIEQDANADTEQVVFYDWGLGSYHNEYSAGAFGHGINKNIMDCYRFIVQNYALGDELYFFGFSRGAYTVRSLAGLLNNCGILDRSNAHLIQTAFEMYKSADIHPDDETSHTLRKNRTVTVELDGLSRDEARKYTHDGCPKVHFVGVWDTVGALGIPFSMLGFLNEKHLFHDRKIGPNMLYARHAMAIDEERDDFQPTIWKQRKGVDIQQVWFAGVHADVGGGYAPDEGGFLLSDYPLEWIAREAGKAGLAISEHLFQRLKPGPTASLHNSKRGIYKVAGTHVRSLSSYLGIHESVKLRWDSDAAYRPKKLKRRIARHGWRGLVS
jgi:uncharacterized protein (DUF2235 family)